MFFIKESMKLLRLINDHDEVNTTYVTDTFSHNISYKYSFYWRVAHVHCPEEDTEM